MTATKMVNLSIEETSGVDHPAHLHEGWIILKHAQRDVVTDTIRTLTNIQEDQHMPNHTDAPSVSKDAEAALTAADATAATDVTVTDDALEKANERIAELEAQIADLTAAAAPAVDSDEAILKAAPAAVREMLEKARNEADAAREELRKERDAQRDREFVQKAAAWQNLAINAAEFGPVLRRLFDLAPEIGEVMEKALSSADAQAESGAIFTEIGKAAPVAEGGDAFSRVQSLAKAAVERGEAHTVEQAIVDVVTANPDLYTDYLAQTRG